MSVTPILDRISKTNFHNTFFQIHTKSCTFYQAQISSILKQTLERKNNLRTTSFSASTRLSHYKEHSNTRKRE